MTTSTTAERLVPAGKCYFDAFDAAGARTGERYLGLTPGFSISIKSESIESYSAEDGIRVLENKILTSLTRTGKLSCRQVSAQNVANFIVGDIATYAQTGASVTNEALLVLPDHYYQLGQSVPPSVSNPVGRQNVSAVSMTAGDAAVTWVTATPKVVGDLIKGVTSPTYFYKCTTAGTTGTPEPTWANAATPGTTLTDGTVVWTNMGNLTPVVTPTTGDFTLDAVLGRIYVLPTAHIHPTIPTPWACDYTYASNSRDRIASSSLARVTGAFRFIANNMQGVNRDLYAPNVLLEPSGEWTLKADKVEFIELGWDLTFSNGANGESALYIDGRAA